MSQNLVIQNWRNIARFCFANLINRPIFAKCRKKFAIFLHNYFAKYVFDKISRNFIQVTNYTKKFRHIQKAFREFCEIAAKSFSKKSIWQNFAKTNNKAKFCKIQKVFRRISAKSFCKKSIWQNVAKFRRITSLANEITRNYVKYLVLWKTIRKISSNTYFAKGFSRNFAKFREILFVFCDISSCY